VVTAVMCVSVLALLVFGLGLFVSMQRFRSKAIAGSDLGPTSPLQKAIRAHGNTIEYAPMLAILFLYLGQAMPSATWVSVLIVAATLSRVSIAMGLLLCRSLENAHPLRFLGGLGTYITGVLLAGVAILTVV